MQFDAARIASNRPEFFYFICFPLSISSDGITQNFKSNMSWERYDFRMGIIFEIISFFRCRRSFEATTRRRRLLRSSLCSSSYLQTFVMNSFRYFHRIFLYIFKHFYRIFTPCSFSKMQTLVLNIFHIMYTIYPSALPCIYKCFILFEIFPMCRNIFRECFKSSLFNHLKYFHV